jgi:phosphoribosylformylglycinamidine synthase
LPDGKQRVTLAWNDSGKFEDRWVYLRKSKIKNQKSKMENQIRNPEINDTKCIWTRGLPDIIYLPVAHGEGKFIADEKLLQELEENNQIVFQYVDEKGNLAGYPYNPNGSLKNIAGISDPSGRILGLMPHPERFIHKTQYPRWRREKIKIPHGRLIFKNAIRFLSR